MPTAPSDLTTLLGRLVQAEVEFVLVGALAGVAQGAPLTTHDVDIVPRRTPSNIDALLACLGSLNARYRGRPDGEILRPAAAALLGPDHSLLMTDLGPLDVLGTIEGGRGFDELEPHTVTLLMAGRPIRVLGLEMLVELERASTDAKGKMAHAVLEATLRRSR